MKAKLPSRSSVVRPSVKPAAKPLSPDAQRFKAASAPPPAPKTPLTARSLNGLSGAQIATLAETRRTGGDMRTLLGKMQQTNTKSWKA